MDKTILVLPGDGIGPEIAPVAVEVLQAAGLKAEFVWDDIGGAAFDRFGTPLVDETLAKARMADAVLLGAVGGPKWEGVARENRPEAGLLRLRKELNLFANLRPAQCRPALVNASSLKPDLVSGLDILIVRELTGGVYFGEPRGVQTLASGVRQAIDTQVYSETEIERILEVAFDLAEKRSGRVCSVEKANVMETGAFWRDIAQSVGKKRKNIDLSHMYADNCAMQLVRAPKQFDVIVTDNLFGDLLSDCAAMLTGSLGMLPSASLGAPNEVGRRPGVFEPVHGSAPDIAGTGKANPCAMILSAAMACRYGLDAPEIADRIEAAVDQALDSGHRTADLAVDGEALNCRAMGNAIIAMLDA